MAMQLRPQSLHAHGIISRALEYGRRLRGLATKHNDELAERVGASALLFEQRPQLFR